MAESLQSAQQSLQQAGQQTAQGQQEATEAEMGQEFGQSGQQGQQGQQGQSGQSGRSGGSSQSQSGSPSSGRGGGLGGPGIGQGGRVGPQQPLPGNKKDNLVKGQQDPRGKKLSRSYMGTPDPTQDRAAYYSVVPDKLKAAESSLNREDIPAGYKKQVKEYFESIQPR
jgi:hypothetical protein